MISIKSNRQKIYYVILIFICVFAVAHSWYYCKQPWGYDVEFGYDETNYINCARRLVETGTFSFWDNGPDAYVTPGFVVLLAFVMKIFGTGYRAIAVMKFFQSITIGLNCLLCWSIGMKVTKNKLSSIIAALFLAVSGSYCYYARFMLTEPLYHFLMLLFTDLFITAVLRMNNNAGDKELTIRFSLAGIALGLTIIVRSPISVILPFLFVPSLVKNGRSRKLLKYAVITYGCMVLVFLPWWIRNFVTLGRFIPFCTQTNAFFYGFTPDPTIYGLEDPGSIIGNLKYIVMFLKDDFIGTIRWMTIDKYRLVFHTDDVLVFAKHNFVNDMFRDFFIYVGGLGLTAGLFIKKYRAYVLFILYFIAMTFIVVPTARYGVQFYPFFCIGSGMVINLLIDAVKRN